MALVTLKGFGFNGFGSSFVVDEETGVNYICLEKYGISPRYDSNGNIMLTPPEKIKVLQEEQRRRDAESAAYWGRNV